jgi:hypothetical protein
VSVWHGKGLLWVHLSHVYSIIMVNFSWLAYKLCSFVQNNYFHHVYSSLVVLTSQIARVLRLEIIIGKFFSQYFLNKKFVFRMFSRGMFSYAGRIYIGHILKAMNSKEQQRSQQRIPLRNVDNLGGCFCQIIT